MQAFDWKNPEQQPFEIGISQSGRPTDEYLQILQRLGRRRLPSELSGVGG